MTRPLRRMHYRMAAGMAVVLPVILSVALLSRPGVPRNDFRDPLRSQAPPDSIVVAELEAPPSLRPRILSANHDLWLELQSSLHLPDLLLYMSIGGRRFFLGTVQGTRKQYFRLPAGASTHRFELRSLAHQTPAASFAWSPEP